MKNVLPIAAVGALLLILWAFLSGKISLGKSQPASSTAGTVSKETPSSLNTTTTVSQIHVPTNVNVKPRPVNPKPVNTSNVTINNTTTEQTSNYNMKIRRPASFQMN